MSEVEKCVAKVFVPDTLGEDVSSGRWVKCGQGREHILHDLSEDDGGHEFTKPALPSVPVEQSASSAPSGSQPEAQRALSQANDRVEEALDLLERHFPVPRTDPRFETARQIADMFRSVQKELEALRGEIFGTNPLSARPADWGLRAMLEGALEQRDMAIARAEAAEAKLKGHKEALPHIGASMAVEKQKLSDAEQELDKAWNATVDTAGLICADVFSLKEKRNLTLSELIVHAIRRVVAETQHDMKEETGDLRAELETFRKLFDSPPELGGEDLSMDMERPSVEVLVEWVKKSKKECEAEGSIFDTGFRCVSEGGTIWEFDPEEIEALSDDNQKLREALGGLRCAHCKLLVSDPAPTYPSPGSCEGCVGARAAILSPTDKLNEL